MGKKFPQQFLLNPKFTPIKPDFKIKWNEKITDTKLSTLEIYVTENDYFVKSFPNIFNNDDYIIDFTTDEDDKRWKATPIKLWQCQVNFALSCATNFCGISNFHMFDTSLPSLVRSVINFHVYFTTRIILSYMECPLPGDEAFVKNNNHINMKKYDDIKRQYNVPESYDFRMFYAMLFNKQPYTYSKDGENGFSYFIPKTSDGLTKPGIQALNSSIRNYVYIILGSQVDTRSKIVSNSGTRFDAQEDFLHKFEKVIKTWNDDNMLPDEIARYQKYITDARIHLNYVIGPNLYLISDNLILNTNFPGYANNILVATGNQYFGINNINESQIPHFPFMSGGPDRNKRLKKQTDSVASKPRVTTNLKKTPDNSSHENVKITLYLLSSLTLGLVMYFK